MEAFKYDVFIIQDYQLYSTVVVKVKNKTSVSFRNFHWIQIR